MNLVQFCVKIALKPEVWLQLKTEFTAMAYLYGPIKPETQDDADRKAKLQPTSKTVTLSILSFFIYSLMPSVNQNAGLVSKKITNIFRAALFRVIFNLQMNKLK